MSVDDQLTPAPDAGAAGGVWTYPPTVLGRVGLALCALAALLFVFTTDGPIVEQDVTGNTVSLSNSIIAYGVVLAVLVALAAAAPWVWARLTGVTLGAVVAGIAGAVVVGARGDDSFREGIDVSLGRGGVVLVVAFFVAALGVLLALVGFRRAPPAGGADAVGGLSTASGKAIASLVLGLVGLILAPVGALAVGFALLARDDIRLSGGTRSGGGIAIAGLVLGILDLAGWGLGLAIGMASVNP
jgi:Domain of unknown function (DUF4190)